MIRRADFNANAHLDAGDIDTLYGHFGDTAWKYDLDASGWPTAMGADQRDVDTLVRTILKTDYGDTQSEARSTAPTTPPSILISTTR